MSCGLSAVEAISRSSTRPWKWDADSLWDVHSLTLASAAALDLVSNCDVVPSTVKYPRPVSSISI